MSLFFRKQAHIERGFENFLGCLQRCLELFVTGMHSYLEHGLGDSFQKSVDLVHRAESEADDLREELERTLYKQELMPDSRGDLLRLLEVCDKTANQAEDVMFFVSMRGISSPKELTDDLKQLLIPVEMSVLTLVRAVRTLFSQPRLVRPIIEEVDACESKADAIQHEIIRKIYTMDLELARKMQLDLLVKEIGTIADFAEVASRRLDITAIKRSL